MNPPFFGSKIMNLLGFFDFEPKKCFRVPTPWGLYGAEWDERLCSLCTFQPFLICWRFWRPRATHSEGCEWGCGDSVCLLGYERTFFVVCSLAEGRSKPVPKTRNDCFHQQWVT